MKFINLFLQYIKIYKHINLSETISEKMSQYLPLIVERCNSLREIFEASSFLVEKDEVIDKKALALIMNIKKYFQISSMQLNQKILPGIPNF